jgi:hypothetical protein
MRKILLMAALSMADFASDGFYIGTYDKKSSLFMNIYNIN